VRELGKAIPSGMWIQNRYTNLHTTLATVEQDLRRELSLPYLTRNLQVHQDEDVVAATDMVLALLTISTEEYHH
jgi:hypothetical protein